MSRKEIHSEVEVDFNKPKDDYRFTITHRSEFDDGFKWSEEVSPRKAGFLLTRLSDFDGLGILDDSIDKSLWYKGYVFTLSSIVPVDFDVNKLDFFKEYAPDVLKYRLKLVQEYCKWVDQQKPFLPKGKVVFNLKDKEW